MDRRESLQHLSPDMRRGHVTRYLLYPLSCVLLFTSGCYRSTPHSFPAKPIKLVVYTGPGGLIDQTARKFAEIASRHCEATFVVENKPGAGGIVAISKVLRTPADGYTLLACTKSNISKIVQTGGEASIDALDWIAMNMADPECVITRADGDLALWDDLERDAKQRPGQQIWVGPAVGGLDHVMALKVWEQAQMEAKWVPYKSGESAKAALLGGQGVAYVGNPQDAIGNQQLRVAAVSSSGRIEQFPDAPTFSELGVSGLDNEFMWRGFAVRKGCPLDVLAWYDRLFQKVNDDPQWRSYWGKRGIQVTYLAREPFTKIVRTDLEQFSHYLRRIGIVHESDDDATGIGGHALPVGISVFIAGSGVLAWMGLGRLIVPAGLAAICMLFVTISYAFPKTESIGPGAVPRLWIVCLLLLCGYQFMKEAKREGLARRSFDLASLKPVWLFGLLVAGYMFAMHWLGYFPSTCVFLWLGMRMLGVQTLSVIVGVALGWLAFSYVLFVRILFVPLPVGRLLEYWTG